MWCFHMSGGGRAGALLACGGAVVMPFSVSVKWEVTQALKVVWWCNHCAF